MKKLGKIAVLLAAITFIFTFVSCDPVTGQLKPEVPLQEEPVQEEPVNEEPAKEEEKKEEPGKDEPAKEEPGKEEPEEIEQEADVKGITVTIDSVSTLEVEQTETQTSIVLIAEDGFTGYNWLIDGDTVTSIEGASVNTDGTVLTLSKSKFKSGTDYQITLSATKNGVPYGTQFSMLWTHVN